MSISAGDTTQEEEETIILIPLDEPAEAPVPEEPAVTPEREPVPA